MSKEFVAKSSVTIDAPAVIVWHALTSPEIIKQCMFGTEVKTDWKVGSPIVWKGEWQGKPYEDKGKILQFEENHVLKYSHFSPMSGAKDVPENYHTVTVKLLHDGVGTIVQLLQDGNKSEESRQHSEKNWNTMLQSLKKILES